jgi:hypothetical protein
MALPSGKTLYQDICRDIESKHSTWGNFTLTIWSYLQDLGERNGLFCSRNPMKDDKVRRKEWLIDLLLTKGEVGRDDFRSIELACEYEGGHGLDGIRYDFQKLLPLRSPLRLFVCHAEQGEETVKRRFDIMQGDVRNWPVPPGEELLAVILRKASRSSEPGTFAVAYGYLFKDEVSESLGPRPLVSRNK